MTIPCIFLGVSGSSLTSNSYEVSLWLALFPKVYFDCLIVFLQMSALRNEKNQKVAGRLWVAGKSVSLVHFSPESVRVKCKQLDYSK